MARVYTNESCPLYGSEYCAMLNMESCRSCTLDCRTEAKAADIRADLDIIRSNMPAGGMEGLFAGDRCRICKGEPGEKKWYALTDLAHAEPRRRKASLLGIAREPRAGVVLPIQIACCDACRKRYLRLEYISSVMGTLFAAVGLIILSVRSLREPIAAIAAILPFLVFVGLTAAGILLGALIKKNLRKKYAGLMHLNVMEQPILSAMAEKGWFELSPNKGFSRLVFAKTPIKQGLFTAMPEEKTAQAPETPVKVE